MNQYKKPKCWNERLDATYPERKQTWMQDRAAIRYAWDYDYNDAADGNSK